VSDEPQEGGDRATRAARLDIDGPLSAHWMTGRTVLVTGGGGRESGPGTVGWAVSRLLAQHGARVAVLDSDPAAELFDVEPDRFSELLDLNLKTAWLMSRRAVPVMAPGSAIVNIASVAAQQAGTVYGLGKAALEAMTGGAAHLLAERGIRANAVELGALWTAGVAGNLGPQAREPRRRMVALQTEGDCWDAAAAVLFLASHQSRWISGQVLTVDGGGRARQPYPGVPRVPVGAGDRAGTAGVVS
jgi:NAD(P)-dependent dehydrogenase (short-subunit alcohol dehydrogenase family)